MNQLAAHITAFIDHFRNMWQGGGGIRRRRQAVQIGFTRSARRKLNWTSRACFDVNDNASLGSSRLRLAAVE